MAADFRICVGGDLRARTNKNPAGTAHTVVSGYNQL